MSFNPNKRYYGPPYRDPERVPMSLLLIGLLITFVVFLWWALA